MTDLTASMQRYVKTIYELSCGGNGVRVTDIAVKLGVSKASSSTAMKALQKKGMVYRDVDRLIFLTKSGEYQAVLANGKALIIQKFLTDMLDVAHDIAKADASTIEHVLSNESICALCRFINRECTGDCYAKTDGVPAGKNKIL